MNSSRQSMSHLPPHVLPTMRTLFDIIDVDKTGYIRFQDLADRWSDNAQFSSTSCIPTNFLESVQKVTPPNGMLTFERFCAGLRLAFAAAKENSSSSYSPDNAPAVPKKGEGLVRRKLPPVGSAKSKAMQQRANLMVLQSALTNQPSSPNRSLSNYENLETIHQQPCQNNQWSSSARNHRPPAPPPPYQNCGQKPWSKSDTKVNCHARNGRSMDKVAPASNSTSSWSSSTLTDDSLDRYRKPKSPEVEIAHAKPVIAQKPQTHRNKPENTNDFRDDEFLNQMLTATPKDSELEVKWKGSENLAMKPDRRRHTITDVHVEEEIRKFENMLRDEKDLLDRGLSTTNKLRRWYQDRLCKLAAVQKLAGNAIMPLDNTVHKEKLNYLRNQVLDLNRRSAIMMEVSKKEFPDHVNLEQAKPLLQQDEDLLCLIRRQNAILAEEMSRKADQLHRVEDQNRRLMEQITIMSHQNGRLGFDLRSPPREHNGYPDFNLYTTSCDNRKPYNTSYSNYEDLAALFNVNNDTYQATLI